MLGKQVGDGKATFLKALKITIENKCRSEIAGASQNKKGKKAMRGTGVVGVLVEQYNPSITGLVKERQIGIRNHLQNLHQSNNISWAGTSVLNDLKSTFELQRDDIILARKKVEPENNSESDEENNLDDAPVPPALQTLRDLWPCLFTVPGLESHHVRLTGRNIRPHLEEFRVEHIKYLNLFLTSNSQSNTKNLALKIKMEQAGHMADFQKEMLGCFLMLANHFQEDNTVFLKTAEVR